MKKLTLFFISVIGCHLSLAKPISMYISATPLVCNNHTYEIEVIQYKYTASDVLFAKSIFDFGDGTNEDLDLSKYEYYKEIGGRRIIKYKVDHTFPGPGVYNVTIRHFNRISGIKNMSNSVNTPLFLKLQIVIDPFLGCNSTPKLENMSFTHKKGQSYMHDFAFTDKENDSLSYHLVTPLQDDIVAVINYWLPKDRDSGSNKLISKISLDQFNGTFLLNSMNLLGLYTVAMEVIEWRKVNGAYYQLSSTALDLNITYVETDNNSPEISQTRDTAIIVGDKFFQEIRVIDQDGDSILLNCFGDLFSSLEIPCIKTTEFLAGPNMKSIAITPQMKHVRPNPYKAVFSVADKRSGYDFLDISKSMYIWITDEAHHPNPVQFFMAKEVSQGVVELNWIDVNDELGFIIERSDQFFPEFHRLAVLPSDAIKYRDSSTVQGVSYIYRIKAVGTTMSAFKEISIATTDLITSLPKYQSNQELDIFPNPSNGSFWISHKQYIKFWEIRDISGNVVWTKNSMFRSGQTKGTNIKTRLSKGMYFIKAYHDQGISSKKILIH